MTKSLKYLAGMLLLAATVALLACGGEEPAAPAPVAEPTAPAASTAMTEQPTGAVPPTPSEAVPMQSGNRLQTVRDRGTLICASNNSLAGFGFIDDNGNTVGFDIDLCRAVAAAVLGDPDAVEYRPTPPPSAAPPCSPAKLT